MSKNRIPLQQAQTYAAEITAALAPFCERIETVGSVRRGRSDVGDIEILLIPRPGFDGHFQQLLLDGVFARNDANGLRLKRVFYAGVSLDLFICRPPAQYGWLQVLRTGSAEFSHWLVTQSRYGGARPSGYVCQNAGWYRDGRVIEMPDEEDVFALIFNCGVPDPAQRAGPLPGMFEIPISPDYEKPFGVEQQGFDLLMDGATL